MDHSTIIRQLPTLPPHLINYVPPAAEERSRSTSSNRNSSKTRTPSLGRRESAPRLGDRLGEDTGKRGRQAERDLGVGNSSSHSRGRTSPVAVRRTGSKAREAKEAKELARAVKLEAKEELLDAEVKPKRVKVGARASIACATCRKRKVRCSGEFPTCQFCAGRSMACVYEGHPHEHGGAPVNPNGGIQGTTSFAFPPNFLPATYEPVLPPAEAILGSLDDFFSHYYDTFYFLHRPTLTASIMTGTAPKELLFCILAFTSRTSLVLQTLPDTPQGGPAASKHFASLAQYILNLPPPSAQDASTSTVPDSSVAEPSLVRCQSYLLLGLYECTEGLDHSGWMKIGIAIRMAQILRLGFEDEDEGSVRVLLTDPLISEARRRTFWSCFKLERLITDGKDRPVALQVPHNSSIRMPGSDLDYVMNIRSNSARFNPSPPAWSRSASAVHLEVEADLYGHTIRVAELWRRVAQYVGEGGRNSDRRAPWMESGFATLERDLNHFQARLPLELQYTDENIVAHSLIGEVRRFAMLHLVFHTTTLVLHRDYLPFLPGFGFDASKGPVDGEPLCVSPDSAPKDWWITCVAKAFDSSIVVSDICARLAQLGTSVVTAFAGFSILAAGTLHLHLKYWPQSYRAPFDANYYVEQDMMVLDSLKHFYPIAKSWESGFIRLHLLYSNLKQGILGVDSGTVRSRVIKLLRTVKEEEDDGTHGARASSPPDFSRQEFRRQASNESESPAHDSLNPPAVDFDMSPFVSISNNSTGPTGMEQDFVSGGGEMDLLSYVDWPNFLSSPPHFLGSPSAHFVASPPAGGELW